MRSLTTRHRLRWVEVLSRRATPGAAWRGRGRVPDGRRPHRGHGGRVLEARGRRRGGYARHAGNTRPSSRPAIRAAMRDRIPGDGPRTRHVVHACGRNQDLEGAAHTGCRRVRPSKGIEQVVSSDRRRPKHCAADEVMRRARYGASVPVGVPGYGRALGKSSVTGTKARPSSTARRSFAASSSRRPTAADRTKKRSMPSISRMRDERPVR